MQIERTTARPSESTRPVLLARGLVKSFGATRALVDGELALHQGEVLALLGENGSGKSTFVKILSGVLAPDDGTLELDGGSVRFRSPRQAQDAGIVTVFQEILVSPDVSVFDNLWLGNGSPVRTRRRLAERRRVSAALLAELTDNAPELNRPVRELDLVSRQLVAIARALLRDPRVLVLDESTSTLDVTLRDRLFDIVRRRCAQGMSAIFISHRMDEVLSFADRFVALRSGRTVGAMNRHDATADELIRLISGDVEATRQQLRPALATDDAPVAIDVRGVVVQPGAQALDLDIREGEIIGLGGLEGHGQERIIRVLAGLAAPVSGTVTYRLGSRSVVAPRYEHAVRAGIVYIPRDRKAEGLADVLSVIDNYALPTLDRDSVFGIIRPSRTRQRFESDARRVNFVPAGQRAAGRLSGGNQQKIILARWLATDPKVLLLNDPTRGVDLRTKRELYEMFRQLAHEGVTVVLLSTEVEELVGLADRVVVYHAGTPHVIDGAQATREHLIGAYFGRTDEGDAA